MAKIDNNKPILQIILEYFLTLASVSVFLFGIIAMCVYPDERDHTQTDCREFVADWEQILSDGSRISVDIPGTVPASPGEVVTITTTLPENLNPREDLCFYNIWQTVSIYVDGELRVNYDTANSRPVGINSPSRYIFLELTEDDAGKELIYNYSSNSKYAGNINNIYIGNKVSIWLHLVKRSGLRTTIALFLLLMSLCCIVVCSILKLVHKMDLPLNHLAWTIFFCTFWMLSEIDFRQLLVKNISILSYYPYWTLMMIPFPLLLYINDIQQGRYKKLYAVPIVYSMSLFVIGTTLQFLDIVQFVSQVTFIHLGILCTILCIIITITMDTINKRLKDYLAVGIGIYGLLLTAVLEMVLYYNSSSMTLGAVLSLGLLFLLIMAIIKTGQDLFDTENKKQQAIMAKEAQAKFLANMSHEIRTPINAIIGMNEMILRENNDDAVQDYAHNIQNASKMLLGLVNDVLDFSQIESGQLTLVENTYHVAPLFQDEMLLLKARTSGKPISIQLDMDTNLPTKCFGDELRIKQIITNLLSNAAKYTERGRITLKATGKQVSDDIFELCVSITDTGLGIKAEDVDNLFDSFKRLELDKNRTIQGTGLGLNIVKQLVDLMNGTITVDSEYGKGSTFTVTIPQKIIDGTPITDMDDAIEKWKAEQDKPQQKFTAPDATVLVVDDNKMNLTLMKQLLKRTKMQVDIASSGKQSLEFTRKKSYDIIFMDHMMPELDGVETLHLLRAEQDNPNQNAFVVALTANAIAGCKEMYLEYGFNDYFSKPVQADKLDAFLIEHLPKDLVSIENETDTLQEPTSKEATETVSSSDLLAIDKNAGLEYCMQDKALYQEMLEAFCEQSKNSMEKLPEFVKTEDWHNYAIIVHGLKSSAQYIGALNFSKLSLQHEHASKDENADYVLAEYQSYMDTLKSLNQQIEEMLTKQ